MHNFTWHERFTWKDRRAGRNETLRRLLRFHLANGLISIAGNVVLMKLIAGVFGVRYLVANVISIAILSLANFAAGNIYVFRAAPAEPH